ncbi:alpha/beta fold hydrolase [Paenibacillus sp. UMB4589-SE434]|uniref:alpha/beta hydrolase n=1 Tax=Paenibacillus sp. UMB4589-SE434 TaxID=3046314 RepID=UPI0025519AE7|nr:alpha/beta fold hydrolase [Paenibacillus sp. UMB4589-SE434]MDK8181936.1 alpha/beta fold hydrolase [Paenibacillus sp. UMB4589-SE434]
MSIIIIVITVAAILLLACWSVIWWLAAKSQSPRRAPIHRKPEQRYDTVTFEGNAQLTGWLVWPDEIKHSSSDKQERYPAIVISHGWGSNRARVLRYADRLSDAGYVLLLYDVTSHGESEAVRAPSALLFRDDIKAAVQYLRNRPEIDPARIGVLGHSLGGFGTLLALDEGLEVAAIVTDSMPSKPFTMVAAELRRRKLPLFPLAWMIPRIWLWRARIPWADYDGLDLASTLCNNAHKGDAQVPVLMVHSNGDTFIPATELTGTIQRLPYQQPHVLVDTPGHSCSEQDERFWDAVLPFYDTYVKDRPAAV